MNMLKQADLHKALTRRCSQREYKGVDVEREVLLNILWAANGKNRECGRHTAPMPMREVIIKLYVASKNGVERYDEDVNMLSNVITDDIRHRIARQEFVSHASHTVIMTGLFKNYKDSVNEQKRNDWTWATAGGVCQNIYLAAAAHELGTVEVVSIHGDEISKLLPFEDGERPMCVMPLGK